MAAQEYPAEKQDVLRGAHDHVDEPIAKEGRDEVSSANAMSEEEFAAHEKKLVRKLDFTLVPMVWLLYLFNYLDRNNIAFVSF